MALDKLRFHNILVQKMDVPSEAAEELADVLDDGLVSQAEIDLLRSEMKAFEARIRELIWRVTLILVGAMATGFSILGAIGIALLVRSG